MSGEYVRDLPNLLHRILALPPQPPGQDPLHPALHSLTEYPPSTTLPEYLIKLEPGEREQILEKGDAAELQYGIDIRDASKVPHEAENPNYYKKAGKNLLCGSCPYERRCMEFRANEYERDKASTAIAKTIIGILDVGNLSRLDVVHSSSSN